MAISIEQWRGQAKHFQFEGKKISYWTGGEGEPLLLVHGYPTAAWDWAPTWDTLGAQHSLIAADMIGFGLSDKPRSGYSILQQADMHLALLKHLEIGEFDAIVHDYGVSVGQELLARQLEGSGAEGLGKMVFLNGGIFPDQHRPVPIQKFGVSPLGFLVGMLINRKGFGKSFSAVFGPDTQPSAKELDEFWSLMTEQDGHRIMHKLLHYIADRRTHEPRWVGVLEQVQDKIGLINGALDPVSGEHAFKRWVEYLPNAKAHLLPDVGHYPHVEAPDRVAAKALEWLT
ncbi:alpha/beta hydrolase [Altererythrobacter sp. ZODW24]|uniref:alpha/beta fold hydrolase n=1 Tax=Altererythrobacter sp. ZODW24 TaxID=2185142 RepID=UPI000DF801FB|nr:alpha/beta hydrolase [Altererythrobacter sp. ZODW24]